MEITYISHFDLYLTSTSGGGFEEINYISHFD